MRGHFRNFLLSLALLAACIHPSYADNFANGLQQPFDWRAAWGTVNFAGSADPGIPSAQLQPKADIKRVISTDGTQTNDLSSLHVYTADMNGDGKDDTIIDGSGYFPQYQNPNAPLQICTAADGCFVSIYVSGQDTDLISAGTAACPATAAANTSCLANCPATEQNCPALFQYNTRTVFSQQVLRWNIVSAASFQAWAMGTSYQPADANPVFVVLRNNINCYNAEIAANNNQCVKYYQYVGDAATGAFVDLFNYEDRTTGSFASLFSYAPFGNNGDILCGLGCPGRGTILLENGAALPSNSSGTGLRLSGHGGTIDIQFSNFSLTPANGGAPIPGDQTSYAVLSTPNFASFHITNASDNDYFVPTGTDKEFSSFVNSTQTGVTITQEKLQFTSWIGDTQCPALVTAAETIAATRFCQSSTSDYRPCSACMAAAAAAVAAGNGAAWPGDWQLGCNTSQNCAVNACIFVEAPADPYIGSAALRAYNGSVTTEKDCENNTPNTVWNVLYQSNGYGAANAVMEYGGCQGAFNHICQQGNFCFAGDTLISLPDGTSKRIDQIKAGDMVLGFKKPKEALKPYKVKTVAVTPQQNLLSINGGELQLTPNHDVVNSKGQKIRASLLKTGDVLLRGDKTKLTVKSIDTVPATSTVYNLKLEDGGAGFVAGGVRVVGYNK
jgi:hypothetical protein